MPEKNSQWLEIEGAKIAVSEISGMKNRFSKNTTEYAVFNFIKHWNAGLSHFEQKSSGSTGAPKTISISRDQMIASAKATVSTLNLKKGDTALLSISPEFIGGKMMIVRAMIAELNLVVGEVSGNPLQHIENDRKIEFFSFVPYQLAKILSENPEKANLLNKASAIILGGAPVNESLASEIKKHLIAPVFSTYGMTETVSHIAIKRINASKEKTFEALQNVYLSQDERGCLVIKAPHITEQERLVTNDVVELHSNQSFDWLGRYDFVINSGGVKLHPEQIEKEIQAVLKQLNNQFFVFGQPHEKLGNALGLAVEGVVDTEKMLSSLKKELPTYHVPKKIYLIPQFTMTASGKVDRVESLRKEGIIFN